MVTPTPWYAREGTAASDKRWTDQRCADHKTSGACHQTTTKSKRYAQGQINARTYTAYIITYIVIYIYIYIYVFYVYMYAHLLPKTEEQPAVRLVDPQEPGLNGIISKIYREYSLAACGSASGYGPAYLSQPHWVSLTESVATQPVSLTQAHSVSFSQSDSVSHSYSVSLTVSVLLSLTHSHSGTQSTSLCQSHSVSLNQSHSLLVKPTHSHTQTHTHSTSITASWR